MTALESSIDILQNIYSKYNDIEVKYELNTGLEYEIHFDLLPYMEEWIDSVDQQSCAGGGLGIDAGGGFSVLTSNRKESCGQQIRFDCGSTARREKAYPYTMRRNSGVKLFFGPQFGRQTFFFRSTIRSSIRSKIRASIQSTILTIILLVHLGINPPIGSPRY